MCEFFWCDYCIFLHYKHVMSCTGYVYPVIKLSKKVLCAFTLYVCRLLLVTKWYKFLISFYIYTIMFVRLLNLLKIYDVRLHYLSKNIGCLFTLPI